MKQALLSLHDGTIDLVDVPDPIPKAGQVVIQTRASLVSSGTERMLVDFGRGGFVAKARSQPEKVRQVFEKVLRDGLLTTYDAVKSKLDQPMPLGYCNAGVVIAIGAGVTDLKVGDRVVSNGAHAEIVAVPRTLCAPIPLRPDGTEVSFEDAAFTVLGAVALESLRLATPTLGERFVVTGLGLVGLITAQLLRASGCQVLGFDTSEERLALARKFGITTYLINDESDPVSFAREWTNGLGPDGVMVAVATDSAKPMTDAAMMCRRRGRIILLGVAKLEFDRGPFFEKEITFQVSSSYGPGRYDPTYEEKGQDYPPGYVRWTAGRNFSAVLEQIATRSIDVVSLVTERIPFVEAQRAWDKLSTPGVLGIVLQYPTRTIHLSERTISIEPTHRRIPQPGIAIIGAGNFAQRTLLPALRELDLAPVVIAAPGGVSATLSARKFGAARATSDTNEAINASDVDAVMILTRHDSHADLVCRALQAGKHVFVEKPLCTTRADLLRIQEAVTASGKILTVGFNRRWAPHVRQAVDLLRGASGPRTVILTVNAGTIPATHWTQDDAVGAGRIIGEGCHFIDLARFLCNSAIASVHSTRLRGHADTASITLEHEDGSISTIHYISSGHPSFAKERIEVFAGGRIIAIDNYRRLHAYGWSLGAGAISLRQDKGHNDMLRAFVGALRNGGPSPIPFAELFEVSSATFDAASQES